MAKKTDNNIDTGRWLERLGEAWMVNKSEVRVLRTELQELVNAVSDLQRKEKTIRGFIKEYEERYSECEVLLDHNKELKRKLRRGEDIVADQHSLSRDFARETTKQQCYVQFISNLKSEIMGEI